MWSLYHVSICFDGKQINWMFGRNMINQILQFFVGRRQIQNPIEKVLEKYVHNVNFTQKTFKTH